jgi:glycosyltransferase involved in cell wall biosynthesis
MYNNNSKNFSALAVMVPVAGALSETFIARQIEKLAPGKTVILTSRVENQVRLPGGVPIYVNKAVVELGHEPLVDSQIIEFLTKYRVSHILCHFGDVSLKIVELNARTLRLPIYVHFHGYDASMALRNPNIVQAYQHMGQMVTGVVAVSTQMAGRLIEIGIPESKIKICPYGVEIPELPLETKHNDQYRFLSVGRLVHKKAPIITLKAFSIARKSVPQMSLDLIGDGPLALEVRNFVESNDLLSSVTLHGARAQEYVKECFARASAFVQHSITDPRTGDAEGLPNTILEAGSYALPVVSTFHEGIADAVIHNETGLLVQEFQVEQMACQMVKLACDSELSRQMGKKARERMLRHYNLCSTIKNLGDFIFGVEKDDQYFESASFESLPGIKITLNHMIDQCLGSLKRGDLAQALKMIEKASKSGEVVRDLEYVKGLCYLAAGDMKKARTAIERELAFFPDNKAAKEMLSGCRVENIVF